MANPQITTVTPQNGRVLYEDCSLKCAIFKYYRIIQWETIYILIYERAMETQKTQKFEVMQGVFGRVQSRNSACLSEWIQSWEERLGFRSRKSFLNKKRKSTTTTKTLKWYEKNEKKKSQNVELFSPSDKQALDSLFEWRWGVVG